MNIFHEAFDILFTPKILCCGELFNYNPLQHGEKTYYRKVIKLKPGNITTIPSCL